MSDLSNNPDRNDDGQRSGNDRDEAARDPGSGCQFLSPEDEALMRELDREMDERIAAWIT
ncbi:hypothetical protein ACERK3_14140 [Phycisphaerales bacterium AB-hyl4]|uniref:Uncharacterized protein n=1 Tax=Natronomicrosphaera hydrolytica TaxID=3242702 RepID=A0ABV4U8I7_9BACT